MSTQGKWQGWVHIKWKPGTPDSVWSTWKANKWVKGVWSTQGEWDCSIWLDVQTPDQLEQFVWSDVRGNQWVEDTHSYWVKQCA